jgi:hypothetical protein
MSESFAVRRLQSTIKDYSKIADAVEGFRKFGPLDIKRLARNWVAAQSCQNPYLSHKDWEWYDPRCEPIFALTAMTWSDWRRALTVCVEIARLSSDPWILEILGAGPLEDVQRKGGCEALRPLLTAARRNPAFRRALRHVWDGGDLRAQLRFARIRDKLEMPLYPE